jgi:hypothetical protein
MTADEIGRLMASADAPDAVLGERLQEAKFRGREFGAALGRILIAIRENTARVTEARDLAGRIDDDAELGREVRRIFGEAWPGEATA